MDKITITKPVNRHFHARQGAALQFLVPLVSSVCRAAVLMGNTLPPIVTAEDALAYRKEVMK